MARSTIALRAKISLLLWWVGKRRGLGPSTGRPVGIEQIIEGPSVLFF